MHEVTVLICDDNEAVHESLKTYLNAAGIRVISAYSGRQALDLIDRTPVDLMILDIMMPDLYGTEVCKAVRRKSDLPIIMLSARDEESDRILGLELGADDYVTKPFSPREVATRVQVILKRVLPKQEADRRIKFQELMIDRDAFEVYIAGQRMDFTPNEKKMITFFVENAGVALSRERILNNVWGYDYYGDTRAVDTLVKRIRRKIPENVHFRIESVYSVGYRLEEVP